MRVERTVIVPGSPELAFDLFTSGIERWWPLRQGFSYGGERAAGIHLEPHLGGRFYERLVDGDELQVGTVLACAPPDRIVFTWAAPGWPTETEVEVSFTSDGTQTVVVLEHRLFEQLGDEAVAVRDRFAGGWPSVLERFATASRTR